MAAERVAAGWRLSALLAGHAALPASAEREVLALTGDSRRVMPGSVFFARAGRSHDGRVFADAAVAAGAVAVVREGEPAVRVREDGAVEVRVPDLAACTAEAAGRFHGDPTASMRVVGVTGTNGKTSVSHFVAAVLHESDSAPCGLLGTLGYGIYGALEAGLHTTPDLLDLQAEFAALRDAGARHAVMEVSSHALDQGRVRGVRLHTGVFTNLSRDHLDYHGDMEAYARAKRRLFEQRGLAAAVLNLDDRHGRTLHAALAGRVPERLGFCLDRQQSAAAVHGRLEAMDAAGLRLRVRTPWGEGTLRSPLAGRFNASNLLAALTALGALQVPLERSLAALAEVQPPPGRMQAFGGGALPLVVVDYAHTPDALATALQALRPQCAGRLLCVFGCGGERDLGKRALMGEAAVRLADRVVVTDDNPRGEDGDRIVADILEGCGSAAVEVERDRGVAIGLAVAEASAGDVVLVAGKGHEPYQEVAGRRLPFSDAAAVRAALAARRGSGV